MNPRSYTAGVVLAGLAGLALVGCKPTSGATSAREAAPPPGDEALHRIPLGAPPGQPISIAASVQNPFEGDAASIVQGKALFSQMNCVYCHGAQGSGLMGPALDSRGWRYGGAPAQIYNSIHDGRPKGMPAWGGRLPPEQIWQLVSYIESLGGAAPPATAQMSTLGGVPPSTTGPQVSGQSQTDTAHAALVSGNQRQGGD